MQHGLHLPLFARELFATRIAAFFGMNVIVSAVSLLCLERLCGDSRLRLSGRALLDRF
jgi:hypothetical protein